MSCLRSRSLGIALAGLLAAAGAFAVEPVAVRDEGPWRIAERATPACATRLWLRMDEATARFRDDCGGSVAAGARRLGELLDALAANDPRALRLRSLDCGRLAQLNPELALRLARAAQADPQWESTGQRRAAGDGAWANRWVAEALSRHDLMREYVQELRARHVEVAGASVEKVLVGAPGSLPELAALRAGDSKDEQSLPWDAIVWLRAAHATGAEPE